MIERTGLVTSLSSVASYLTSFRKRLPVKDGLLSGDLRRDVHQVLFPGRVQGSGLRVEG